MTMTSSGLSEKNIAAPISTPPITRLTSSRIHSAIVLPICS